jgi:hypothetical protein
MTEYTKTMIEALQINQLIEELSGDFPLASKQERLVKYLEEITRPQKLSEKAMELFFSGLPRKAKIFANYLILESDTGDVGISFYNDPNFDFSTYSGIANVIENRQDITLYNSINGKTVKLKSLSIIYLNVLAQHC